MLLLRIMNKPPLPSNDILTRLMADADRRMGTANLEPPLGRTLLNRLLTANVFVMTTVATAAGGVFLFGLL